MSSDTTQVNHRAVGVNIYNDEHGNFSVHAHDRLTGRTIISGPWRSTIQGAVEAAGVALTLTPPPSPRVRVLDEKQADVLDAYPDVVLDKHGRLVTAVCEPEEGFTLPWWDKNRPKGAPHRMGKLAVIDPALADADAGGAE